jgi:hypothetical protein
MMPSSARITGLSRQLTTVTMIDLRGKATRSTYDDLVGLVSSVDSTQVSDCLQGVTQAFSDWLHEGDPESLDFIASLFLWLPPERQPDAWDAINAWIRASSQQWLAVASTDLGSALHLARLGILSPGELVRLHGAGTLFRDQPRTVYTPTQGLMPIAVVFLDRVARNLYEPGILLQWARELLTHLVRDPPPWRSYCYRRIPETVARPLTITCDPVSGLALSVLIGGMIAISGKDYARVVLGANNSLRDSYKNMANGDLGALPSDLRDPYMVAFLRKVNSLNKSNSQLVHWSAAEQGVARLAEGRRRMGRRSEGQTSKGTS